MTDAELQHAAHVLANVRPIPDALLQQLLAAAREANRLRDGLIKLEHDVQQTLGAALGYPRHVDDPANFPGATEGDGVCVGVEVAETLAIEAAEKIRLLQVTIATETQRCASIAHTRMEWRP